MTRRLLIAALALVLAAPVAVLAHPGHDHKVMGTIAVIDGRHVTVTTTDKKELTFAVTDATKLTRGRTRGTFADLKVGMRVVANVGDGEEPLTAKEIQYAAAPAATDKQ